MKIKVKDRQNLFDLALRERGRLEDAFEIAVAWGHPLSDEPGDEDILEVPETTDNVVTRRYLSAGIDPATGLTKEEREELDLDGIEFMSVEVDFRIY